MRSKEFREIQVSSSALVFIFLGVLVLGVFIFLLGISVGKKQTQMAGPSTIIAERIPTQTLPPAEEPSAKLDSQGPKAVQESAKETVSEPQKVLPDRVTTEAPPKEVKVPTEKRKAESKTLNATRNGLYFIQVGAFNEKGQASELAANFMKQGYSAVVLDPLPTDAKTVYRVRLGGYKTNEQASQILAKLKSASKKKTGYYITKG